jgi:hypothetical protein
MRCQMRRRYETRKRALHAASVGGKKRRIELFTYKCPLCRFWHLTHHEQFGRQDGELDREQQASRAPVASAPA